MNKIGSHFAVNLLPQESGYTMTKRNTILIVDDDPGIIEIVSHILDNAGYDTIADTTGDLDVLKNNQYPNLILLDNLLGSKNGSDICRQLKSDELTRHIPVILISGTEGLYGIAENACADDFLSKPFSIRNLLQKIDFLLTDIASTS